MDELVMRFGNEEGLLVELAWDQHVPTPDSTGADATRGRLRLSVRGMAVWHAEDPHEGFLWTWIELLEHLASVWAYLLWEDNLPLGLRMAGPASIATQAETRWDEMSATSREQEEQDFEAFEEAHNLARAVQGAKVGSVWIVREGELASICADSRVVTRPSPEVLDALEAAAEAIADRLRELPNDERSIGALTAWRGRTDLSSAARVQIATGLPEPVLRALDGGDAHTAWEIDEADFQLNELLAVARLAAGLPPVAVADVVRHVRDVPRVATEELDDLAASAEAQVGTDGHQAFEQGHAVATWLRDALAYGQHGRVDPDDLLSRWGVKLVELSLDAPDVDAFACWGSRHGPAVFVNAAGRHNQSAGGRRATLAHEIGHLMLDRRGALPLAEVLGGRSSAFAEARARAFAAEFLLPSEEAGRVMAAAKDPETAIRTLQQRYRVSQEVVAWQARNSGRVLPSHVWNVLRTRVSRPSQF